GGGVEIMAACDRRVAIGGPRLVFPFGQHGIELDRLPRWRLGQIVGEDVARRLAAGRHVVEAGGAHRQRLLDQPATELAAIARAEASRSPARPPGPSILRAGETFEEAVRRAAGPMLRVFPPHRTS